MHPIMSPQAVLEVQRNVIFSTLNPCNILFAIWWGVDIDWPQIYFHFTAAGFENISYQSKFFYFYFPLTYRSQINLLARVIPHVFLCRFNKLKKNITKSIKSNTKWYYITHGIVANKIKALITLEIFKTLFSINFLWGDIKWNWWQHLVLKLRLIFLEWVMWTLLYLRMAMYT